MATSSLVSTLSAWRFISDASTSGALSWRPSIGTAAERAFPRASREREERGRSGGHRSHRGSIFTGGSRFFTGTRDIHAGLPPLRLSPGHADNANEGKMETSGASTAECGSTERHGVQNLRMEAPHFLLPPFLPRCSPLWAICPPPTIGVPGGGHQVEPGEEERWEWSRHQTQRGLRHTLLALLRSEVAC